MGAVVNRGRVQKRKKMKRRQDRVAKGKSIIPIRKIEQRILLIRGEKVIIDADLADFYGVQSFLSINF